MSLHTKIENIKAQIVDTERLLKSVINHPIMSNSLKERLELLHKELAELPKTIDEPKVKLLFSGNAVIGSQGIKSSFVSKTIFPFQEMLKTQIALIRFGKVGNRGRTKKGANTELYLTALPVGSFGIELSQLQTNDLFESVDVSNAIKEVMSLIENTAIDDEIFEKTIENTPKRNLSNLKKFLEEIYEEKSILKMECGEKYLELPENKIKEAYYRVSSTSDEEKEIVINGIFRGLLLDSAKFEIQNDLGKRITGFISPELSEEQLIEYDRKFLNNNCVIHLKEHRTKFNTGKEKKDYELLEITETKE